MYRRYAIVDSQMHVEAAAKLTAYAIEEKARAKFRQGQLRRFQKAQAS